jgi:hypothetical protein
LVLEEFNLYFVEKNMNCNFIAFKAIYINKNEVSSVSILMPNGIRKETFEQNPKEFRELYQRKKEIKSIKMLINNISVKFNLSEVYSTGLEYCFISEDWKQACAFVHCKDFEACGLQ